MRIFEVYKEIAKDIEPNTIATLVLFYICKDHNLEYDQAYFDDEYFRDKYAYHNNKTIESLKKLAKILGKSPTSRELKSLGL